VPQLANVRHVYIILTYNGGHQYRYCGR